jgi:hypothetical protein
VPLHIVPEREEGHQRDEACPCSPSKTEGYATVGVGRNRHPYRGEIVTHRPFVEAPTPAPDDETAGDTDCGHVIVTEHGVEQHHQIPDDSVPHAPTSECGCKPQRVTAGGHVVYVHPDPDGDTDAALWHEHADQDGGAQ